MHAHVCVEGSKGVGLKERPASWHRKWRMVQRKANAVHPLPAPAFAHGCVHQSPALCALGFSLRLDSVVGLWPLG